MSREIKFRAWDSEDESYIKNSTRSIKVNYISNYLVKPCMWELEQFTGLTDKNGKDIYEGDIVTSHFKSRLEFNAIVEDDICNPCFVLKPINYKYKYHIEYDFVACGLRSLEVIGNIHEDKHLLK